MEDIIHTGQEVCKYKVSSMREDYITILLLHNQSINFQYGWIYIALFG